MSQLPRIAVGTTQPEADGTALVWALMDAFETSGVRVQSFLSRACFPSRDGATAITGLAPRHLDSWLMSEDTCRELFVRGCTSSELAIVEGSFCTAKSCAGGTLSTLCHWLELPRLAIVDARRLDGCQLPQRPEELDGLLLDGVDGEAEACRLGTLFDALWNVPVLGWLGLLPELRRHIDSIPSGGRPDVAVCRQLSHELARHANLPRIYELAKRPFRACCWVHCSACHRGQPLQVAVACDDALGGYCPDTLELLESRGAVVCDFSPLRDDRLPAGTDLVYLGCGHPERFAAELANNDCMILALKNHLCSGRRIYAECGGLAYLCQQIELPDGQRWPMAGALPLTAHYQDTAAAPEAAEVTLVADTWLGQPPLSCRGYVNPQWTLTPAGAAGACVAEAGHELDVVHCHQAIGSRLYLDFAARADLLERFFQPHHLGIEPAGARGSRWV